MGQEPEEGSLRVRGVCLPDCRNWVLEIWEKIIPHAKEIFLGWAEANGDAQFLKAVERFEHLGKNVKARGGSK